MTDWYRFLYNSRWAMCIFYLNSEGGLFYDPSSPDVCWFACCIDVYCTLRLEIDCCVDDT